MVFIYGMAVGGILVYLGAQIEKQKANDQRLRKILDDVDKEFPTTLDGRFYSTDIAIKSISNKAGD